MKFDLNTNQAFEVRHNAPSENDIDEMLKVVGCKSLDQLIDETVPSHIRSVNPLNLPEAKSEKAFLEDFKKLAGKNKIFKSYIGMGYKDCVVPGVIQRNILENPGWYTAYTPYQAEIAQGRLEALINFQTMLINLTGMEIANASLLDEGTAAGEAMTMLYNLRKGDKKASVKFIVDKNTFPQTIDILKTRALPLGIDLVVGEISKVDFADNAIFGVLVQYPNSNGLVIDYSSIISKAHKAGAFVAMAADIMSLVVLKSPGEMGADVVVGTTQQFGVPMGYGGPHAAYFATRESFKRSIPGRIIGVSVDAVGNKAYRMALQTREQHIRREKATSNICTAQVLLAVMAGMYAVYHGSEGIKFIAQKINSLATRLSNDLRQIGFKQKNEVFFDTVKISIPSPVDKAAIQKRAERLGINFRYFEDSFIGITIDETTSIDDIGDIVKIFARHAEQKFVFRTTDVEAKSSIPADLLRNKEVLDHPVFNSYHSEHAMLRYIKRLENKDLSLVHSMISLGSCTMKLNATSEMIPVTWPEFGKIHPFVPKSQAEGYRLLFKELELWLSEITGFKATSLQPNSGAQGEYAGLMAIRAYHNYRSESHRNITLIPSSAHGTNPASAVLAGTKVVVVKCDDLGNIDIEDLKEKAERHKQYLAALMVTYPSTHGVFEEGIKEICSIIHRNGGQVYMDGANMNAQVGLTSPAAIGADVCHLNLHKTFCIPHGGGGPGMGPICVASHLQPFLPTSSLVVTGGAKSTEVISAAPWGSASILTISYAYIAMMGGNGLTNATKLSILNANYIKSRLEGHFDVLYSGSKGRCAHETIIDCRSFKVDGVEVEDIAKRLMDYGYHAPTVSFPVAGTMMIEPTESEPKEELDRFCEAMISIRREITEVAEGKADPARNVLKNAPHTAELLTADHWEMPYSRAKAAYPLDFVKVNKFWPAVRRIDSAYGDRNLMCSCEPIVNYQEEAVLEN